MLYSKLSPCIFIIIIQKNIKDYDKSINKKNNVYLNEYVNYKYFLMFEYTNLNRLMNINI